MPDQSPRPRRKYVTTLTAEQRRLRAQLAANTRWARTADREAATRTAREARRASFYADADAQGVTDPKLRDAMADAAERAHMARMRYRRTRSAAEAADDDDTAADGAA